jgi:hypothetical protein
MAIGVISDSRRQVIGGQAGGRKDFFDFLKDRVT